MENLTAAKAWTKTVHNDTYDFISTAKADLSGTSVFITGASKGIGRATALSYAAAGCSKIAIGARSDLASLAEEIKKAAAAAHKAQPHIVTLKLDVTSDESVKAAADKVAAEFGGALDVLVNNAGYLEDWRAVGESNPGEWWTTWEINIKGTYLCSRYFIPLLLKGNLKTNILTSSFGAIMVAPTASAYQATKFAVSFPLRNQNQYLFSVSLSIEGKVALQRPKFP
jgi:NAD(P)-dependent dehydrogenase (short-subunit alcohol dehydrogenase family)